MHKAAGMDVRDSPRDLQNEVVLLLRTQGRQLRRSLRCELRQRAVCELGDEHRTALGTCRHSIELQTVGMVQSLLDVHLAIKVDLVALRQLLLPHLHSDFFVIIDATHEAKAIPLTPCTQRRRILGQARCL